MKSFRIYIAFFILVILGYASYTMLSDPKVNWMITLDPEDKNPFGAFVLNERLPDVFQQGSESSYLTLSQLSQERNLFILANQLDLSEPDISTLFETLEKGGSVLLAANDFNKPLLDTLKIESSKGFRFLSEALLESQLDTFNISGRSYLYPFELIENSFILSDSTNWNIEATSSNGITAISQEIGKGKLVLANTPLVFTNFGLLYKENHQVAESLLNLLPNESLHYSQFYQLGKSEASTPLRYFLSQPALRWAVYLALFAILTLLIVDSRRKQRLINIVEPPKNTSMLYARTLGGLYFREGDHARAAQKMVSHFLLQVKEKYYLEVDFSEKFYLKLAGKMGREVGQVRSTFEYLKKLRLKSASISEGDLIKLSKKIDELS